MNSITGTQQKAPPINIRNTYYNNTKKRLYKYYPQCYDQTIERKKSSKSHDEREDDVMRTKLQNSEMVKKGEYGWVICGASALLLFCIAGLASTGFATYQPYLIKIGGLTNTQSSTVILFRTLFTLIGMLFADKLIERFDIKRVIVCGMLVCAGSFALYASAAGYPVYCAASALAGFAHGFSGMIPAAILIGRWFNAHRAFAIGICTASTGVSSMIAPQVVTLLVEKFSLQASFLAECAFVLLSGLAILLFVYNRPEDLHTVPVGAGRGETASKTYAEHDASRELYVLMLAGMTFFGMSAYTVSSHISVLYGTEGYDTASIASMLSIFGVTLALGKCLYGVIADKIGTYRTSWIFHGLSLAGIALACLAGNGSILTSMLAVVVMGLGQAIITVSIPMYASLISTEKNYGKTVTRFHICLSLGGVVFGSVPGRIADLTGSYVPAYAVIFVLSAAAAIILQMTYHKIRMEDHAYVAAQRTLRVAHAH